MRSLSIGPAPSSSPGFPGARRRTGMPRIGGAQLLSILAFGTLVLLVHRFEAPAALGGALVLVGGAFVLFRPELATLLMVFLLYTNVPVLAYKYHGVPQPVAGAFILLLLLPLGHYLIVRRERVRTDGVFYLMLLYLAVLVLTSFWARGPAVAAKHIQNYLLEGLLIYWLVVNVVRGLPTLRRVIWTLLAAGSLLGGLSLYQEVTGAFHHQFGGLAHRNYDFMVLERQIEANPDDTVLRELKAGMTGDRSKRAEGPMDEPNAYAQIMLVLLPLALYMYRSGKARRSRLLAAAAGALIFGGMVVSHSRGALVGLALVALAAAYLRWVRPAHLVLCVLAGIAVVPFVASERLLQRITSIATAVDVLKGNPGAEADAAVQGRATEMMAAFQVFVDHPVLGVGPGQYAPFYSVEYHQKNPRLKFKDLRITRRAHSLYLELAAEVGLVGLTVFLAVVLALMRELLRARNRWMSRRSDLADLATAAWLSLCAYLATAIFLHLMYERYYWFLLALASAALHVIRSHEPAEDRPLRWEERAA